MRANVWDTNVITRQIWVGASDISACDLRHLCLRRLLPALVRTTVQQAAVKAINLSLYALWRERNPSLTLTGACGDSVGEYAELYAAGVFTREDLFRVIVFRSPLSDELNQRHRGTMLAVKSIDHHALKALIAAGEEEVDICCDNMPQQQVAGGCVLRR